MYDNFFFYRSKVRETNLQRTQRRVVDLLHFWVEGFYPVDFEDNEDLINSLQFFIEEQVCLFCLFVVFVGELFTHLEMSLALGEVL